MLAMVVNDNAGFLNSRGVLGFFASVLAPTGPRASVGASMLAMVVNDNAGFLNSRGVLGFFASVLAPTGPRASVGASMLAMVVNDNAGSLNSRGVLGFFASVLAPTGPRASVERACSQCSSTMTRRSDPAGVRFVSLAITPGYRCMFCFD
jgi:hypothetical protein